MPDRSSPHPLEPSTPEMRSMADAASSFLIRFIEGLDEAPASDLSAIVAARRAGLPDEFLDGTMYVTDQVHASVTKSAVLAGFPQRAVRPVPRDAALRMDPEALRHLIRRDRDGGARPFLVVPS